MRQPIIREGSDTFDRLRRDYEAGVAQATLAERYNVAKATIRRMSEGYGWLRTNRIAGGRQHRRDTRVNVGDVMTRVTFLEWVMKAAHGDRIIYYVGDLSADAIKADDQAARKAIARLQAETYSAYEDGSIILTRQRIDQSRFEYIAVKVG